jgi:hypothetical protein
MISSPGTTSVVHAETLLTVDGLSISYFEDEAWAAIGGEIAFQSWGAENSFFFPSG